MAYTNPARVDSPKAAISKLKVLFDGGEQVANGGDWSGWSVAEFDWYDVPALGMRWNGSTQNPDTSAVGNPQSRGLPTWFVLPTPVAKGVRKCLKEAPTVHDIRPFPETPEAIALGCKCSVARQRDGSPHLDASGNPLYAMTKGCPIPSHN
jgi:hypothetical protein